MAVIFCLADVVGTGTHRDAFRSPIADWVYLRKGRRCRTDMARSQITGLPVKPWVFCVVQADDNDFSALNGDLRITFLARFNQLDDPPAQALVDALALRGITRDLSDLTTQQVLLRARRALKPLVRGLD